MYGTTTESLIRIGSSIYACMAIGDRYKALLADRQNSLFYLYRLNETEHEMVLFLYSMCFKLTAGV